ncbi:peptidoglycan recognition protein family protein [Oceanobacillus picturae]|uniref:peptidoglycan recognition protein family protein n=1 Tax=Oceanobacillus picturae TaxID=171693 RepID=UPI00362EA541
MKKIILVLSMLLIVSTIGTMDLIFAEDNTEESESSDTLQGLNEENDKNHLGIKYGTEVYGEDISELSEEELQYIPEGWRDGKFEDRHKNESEILSRLFSVYPDVNNYIKNFDEASVEYQHKDFFTKFNYRNGFGSVEGVVAHETANDNSTITSEISYMSSNHKNAFVHAFVDNERIIQIHPLDHGAWGAGRFANQRFVHVELVRTRNFDEFAKSINNYASYIAHVLYDYKLGISSAENSGNGTVWSHSAVSKHLGGTNHVDPHGYFSRYGYNWNQFMALLNEKYTELVASKSPNTSKLAHFKSEAVRIYKNPANLHSYVKAGSNLTHSVYYIKAQANLNRVNYYLISKNPSSTTGVVGWVKAADLSTTSHVGLDKEAKTFYVKGTGSAYGKAWGGSKDVVYGDLTSYAGKAFKVHLTEKVGNDHWYRGTLDGKTVWIHPNNLVNKEVSRTSRLGHLKSATVKIYQKIGDASTGTPAGSTYTNAVYYIKKQAKYGEETYYLISKNPSSTTGVVGWVKAADLSTTSHVGLDKKAKTFYVKGTGSAYSKAWGGSKDVVYRNLSQYSGEPFKVHLTEKVGSDHWYRGTLSGKTVWIHPNNLVNKEESRTSRLGHLKSATVKIYQEIGDASTGTPAGSTYTNAVYYIKKQARYGDETYYLISKNPSSTTGVVGWVKAADLSTTSHVGLDKEAKTFYVKGTGSAYGKAWGGSKDVVYGDLTSYAGKAFKVHLTEKVGNDHWYRGTLDGKTVWIHPNNLVNKEESRTSRLGHLKSATVKIYQKIGDASTGTPAGSTYTNAVYYIKKQARYGEETYYLISKNPSSTTGVVGWVKAADLSTTSHVGLDKEAKTFYVKGTGSAYGKAWGGSKDVVYGDLTSYAGKAFKVHLTEKVGNDHWYRGTLGDKTVWISETNVK